MLQLVLQLHNTLQFMHASTCQFISSSTVRACEHLAAKLKCVKQNQKLDK